ncbi:MAG: PSD1 and planctomycete cytochrome C domain-containing protein [Planctomycetota bacterium]
MMVLIGCLHRSIPVVVCSLLATSIACAQNPDTPTRQDSDATARTDFAPIEAIFKDHCWQCHGTDQREGGLRLTNRSDAFAENDSGVVAIVAGDPEKSELIKRILSDDPDLQMPPDGDRLTPAQIETIKRWIQADAPFPESTDSTHWAYVPAVRPNIPLASKAAHPIDAFVLEKLKQSGLQPSPTADPARLIRRVSLALTGLPPSLAQVDRFVNNPTDKAYEAFVDECLASPAFGERWAQPWLDVARYADSNGYQADQLRDSWAFRDWVIESINRDQPFDQFSIEQLAGDLIPEATVSQKIATGFHRTVTCNVEAGVHPEENRVNQVFDRVNTTGTAFLGTTLECCQCHNHKYDPFTQDEYYQIFAFFNNTPVEVKLNSGVQYDFVGPSMDLPFDDEQQSRIAKINAELKQAQASLKKVEAEIQSSRDARKSALLQQLAQRPRWHAITTYGVETTGGESSTILPDQSVLIGGSLPGTSTYTVNGLSDLLQIRAIKLEVLTHESLPGKGPGRGDEIRTNFILNSFSATDVTEQAKPLALINAKADFSQSGWPVSAAIDDDAKSGWAIAPEFSTNHWATFEIQQTKTETTDGKPDGNRPTSAQQTNYGPKKFKFTLEQNYGRGRTLGRFRILVSDASYDVITMPESIKRLLRSDSLTPKQTATLNEYLDANHPQRNQLRQRIKEIQKRIDAESPKTTLVMVEMEQPRQTRKMIRGEYLNPGKEIAPGVPSVLHELDSQLPKNRLGFAKWVANKENPLFARVAVNRWWATLFGKGLVKSEEDFGTQSDPPTHPRLLDWLATELVQQGWSRKKVIKSIVMSATYRQRSHVTPALMEIDPQNDLYARGPRLRMPAEMIRDNALTVSGLLSDKMGGAPVMPFQPSNLWRSVGRNAPKWKEQFNDDRFRRGVYVIWRRAAPYPSFVNFDAPDRASCLVRRPSTNTPLQALTLLNDRAYLEMSFALAHRATQVSTDSSRDQIRHAMRLCLSRVPSDEELNLLEGLYQSELERFLTPAAKPKTKPKKGQEKTKPPRVEFAQTVAYGIKRSHPDFKDVKVTAELAAMTVVTNVILNLDETINF